MSLLSETFPESDTSTVSFNTGTMFDLTTGVFEQGKDGKMYLTGGLGCQLTGVVGRNSNFKSTVAASLIMRAANIYNDVGVLVFDTENSIMRDRNRALGMAEELAGNIDENQVVWLSGANMSLEEFDSKLLDHCKKKEAAAKDLMVETPFLDENHKPIMQLIPTFVFIDSLTEAYCGSEEEMMDELHSAKSGLEDSKSNTVFMKDGNRKTLWTRTLRRRCEKYGLVMVVTGHYDQKMAIDMYHPNPKETLFGKQDWVVKGVGSKFKFLSSIYAKTEASELKDSNGDPMYQTPGNTVARDLWEVNMYIDRCKSTAAGTVTSYVCSQTSGLLNAVTYYHYIRSNEYYGCNGSKQKQQLKLMPDVTISRNTIRQLVDSNAQLRRALEITAHFCFAKNKFHPQFAYDLNEDPNHILDWLLSDKQKDLKDEILNSRGYWTYKQDDKPYMSIYDILAIINSKKG